MTEKKIAVKKAKRNEYLFRLHKAPVLSPVFKRPQFVRTGVFSGRVIFWGLGFWRI